MPRRYACCNVGLGLYLSIIIIALPTLIQAEPNPPDAGRAQRGAMLLSQGRWEEAIKEFKIALSTESDQAEIHTNLGMAYYFKGDSASAALAFQAALHLDQERIDATHGLGLALYDQGDFDGAAVAFRTSSQKNPAAYYNLGNALEQKGDQEGAIDAYQHYLAAAPPSAETAALDNALHQHTFPTPAAGTAQDHFRRGQALLEKNDAAGAIPAFFSALRLKPNYVETSNSLGLAFRAAGNLDEAIAAYQNAIHLNLQFSVAYRNLGQAFEEKGERTAAAQAYDRYLILAPGSTDAADIRTRIAKLRGGQ